MEGAKLEAEALVTQTRAECRAMVQEAQELRARVLADLTRRRRVLHSQIEQLRAGRERLAETIGDVRNAVDNITDELFRAEDEARLAAEVAGRQAAQEELAALSEGGASADDGGAPADFAPGAGPDPDTRQSVEELFARLRAEAGAPPEPGAQADSGAQPAPAAQPAADEGPAPVDAAQSRALPDDVIESVRIIPATAPPKAASAPEEQERGRAGAQARASPVVVVARSAEVFGRTAGIGVGRRGARCRREFDGRRRGGGRGSGRGRRGGGRGDGTGPRPGRGASATRCSTRSWPASQAGSSGLCRTTRTTSSTGSGPRAAGLPASSPPRTTMPSATRRWPPSSCGRRPAPVPPSPAARPTTPKASTTSPAPWPRRSWPRCVDASRRRARRWTKATSRALVELVGAAFREWKGARTERLAGDRTVFAFARAALGAVPAGTMLRWIVDDDVAHCPDCDDNALAGAVASPEEFPTGHRHPPAHAGCRCLLVPANA